MYRSNADDLWTGFEVFEGTAFGHNQTLARSLTGLKQSSSDKTSAAIKVGVGETGSMPVIRPFPGGSP